MIVRRFIIPLLLLAGCTADAPSERRDTASLVRLADSEARGLDPQAFSDLASLRVATDQFEGLTRFNAAGQPEPGLAIGWRESADGLIWRFRLKDDTRFSDGKPIDAAVFVAVWQRLQSSKLASPHLPLVAPIKAIEAEDARTVRIILARPMPELPVLLAHPALAALPVHRIAAAGEGWTGERPLVTSGAYRVRYWRLNSALLLERNPQWHGGAAAFARVRWQPVDDALAGIRLFESDAADIVGDVPESRLPQLRASLGQQLRVTPQLGTYYFAFNTRKPPFDDVRVRQALSIAVDRDWLSANLTRSGAPAADGIVPPELYGGNSPNIARLSLPVGQRHIVARGLLEQAGYNAEKPLQFEIRINSSATHRRMAVALAAMWARVGVDARILNSEASLHFASLRRGDFAVARSGWIADLPAAENFLDVHRSDAGPTNYSGYANPAYDAALDQAMAISDPAKRALAMQQAEAILLADAPVIPLLHEVSRSLVDERVTGWQDNSANIHPSATLAPRNIR